MQSSIIWITHPREVWDAFPISTTRVIAIVDWSYFPSLSAIPGLAVPLRHRTLLEELIFWTVKYEFPQKQVTLLLSLLPDPNYKASVISQKIFSLSINSLAPERWHGSNF